MIPRDTDRFLKKLHKLGATGVVQCYYKTEPEGCTLHKALSSVGINCHLIALSLIPKQSGRRVKTVRLDAENLTHYLRSGDLVEVRFPDRRTESMWNLVRLREDAGFTWHKARLISV